MVAQPISAPKGLRARYFAKVVNGQQKRCSVKETVKFKGLFHCFFPQNWRTIGPLITIVVRKTPNVPINVHDYFSGCERGKYRRDTISVCTNDSRFVQLIVFFSSRSRACPLAKGAGPRD